MAYNVIARRGESRYTKDSDKYNTDLKPSKSSSKSGRSAVTYVDARTGEEFQKVAVLNEKGKKTNRTVRVTTKAAQNEPERGSGTVRVKQYSRSSGDSMRVGPTIERAERAQRFQATETPLNEMQEGERVQQITKQSKEKNIFQRIGEFNEQGVQRLKDGAGLVTRKVTDLFNEKDAFGRVVVKDKQGNIIGYRETQGQETERAFRTSKTTGALVQNVATDLLVDPITLLTAPLAVGGAAKGAQAVQKSGGIVKAVKAAKAAKAVKAAQAAKAAKGLSTGAKFGRASLAFGKGLGSTGVKLVVSDRAVKTAYPLVDEAILTRKAKQAGVNKNQLRNVVGEARGAGFKGANEALSSQPFYKQIAGDLNLFFTDKKAYQEAAAKRITESNLSAKEKEAALAAVKSQRTGRASTQLAADVAFSTLAELQGRKTTAEIVQAFGPVTSKSTGKISRSVAAKAAFGTIPAGIFEGAASELNKQTATMQERDIKRAAQAGAIGGATTFVLSGSLAGLQTSKALKGKKGFDLTSLFNLGVNVVDPYEAIGDVSATGIQKVGTKITGKIPKTAVVTNTGGLFTLTTIGGKQPATSGGKQKPKDGGFFNPLNNILNEFTNPFAKTGKGKGKGGKGGGLGGLPINKAKDFTVGFAPSSKTRTSTKTTTRTQPSTPSKSNPFNIAINPIVPIPTEPRIRPTDKKPTEPIIPPPIDIGTTIPIITEPRTERQTTPTQPVIPVPVFNIAATVPTATPQPRLLPPFLVPPNLGGYTGAGQGNTTGRRYVNELSFAIGSILGTPQKNKTFVRNRSPPKKSMKKRVSRRGKKRR